ncbi:hypothetical protein ACLMJK_000502 [Lecanora helva]
MTQERDVYISDHSEVVLKMHGIRTAADSAAYLLPSLRSDMKILDIGCGPGSITVGLAASVPKGHVIGVDYGREVIKEARAMVDERGLKNITFQVGDANALEFADHSFDVVHAHQVLQHLGHPSRALQEWSRLVKPGGLLACREADRESVAYFPMSKGITDFENTWIRTARSRGGEPNGGRHLVAWARAAGIERSKIRATASVWCYSSPDERADYANMWINRILHSSTRDHLQTDGKATGEDLENFVKGWQKWTVDDDGWLSQVVAARSLVNTPHLDINSPSIANTTSGNTLLSAPPFPYYEAYKIPGTSLILHLTLLRPMSRDAMQACLQTATLWINHQKQTSEMQQRTFLWEDPAGALFYVESLSRRLTWGEIGQVLRGLKQDLYDEHRSFVASFTIEDCVDEHIIGKGRLSEYTPRASTLVWSNTYGPSSQS